ncbi:MAG: hypothetical protein IPM79_08235 [Polyangiaceae bacterium]|nr:hypothetical protein [Polyangiaceae bacterium]MBK8937621.1 hypothetical protein [Polyangiaceae bacterium]
MLPARVPSNPDLDYTANEPSVLDDLPVALEPASFDTSSELVPIVRRATYTFDGRSDGGEELAIATGVDTSAWRSGTLVVLVHDLSGWSDTAVLRVRGYSVSLVPDDPERTFAAEPAFVSGFTISATTLPGCQVRAFAFVGPQAEVRLVFDQGAVEATGTQTLTLSVYLLGRR